MLLIIFKIFISSYARSEADVQFCPCFESLFGCSLFISLRHVVALIEEDDLFEEVSLMNLSL